MPYKNRKAQQEFQRRWIANRRAEYVQTHGGCCKTCGSTFKLEFHHVDPSQKEDHRIWSWRRERIEAELAKCILLCKRCHDVITFGLRTYEAQPLVSDAGAEPATSTST